MTDKEVCQYLRLARRKSDILARSGIGWRPEYREELRELDEQLKPLRAKVDQAHAERRKGGQSMQHIMK